MTDQQHDITVLHAVWTDGRLHLWGEQHPPNRSRYAPGTTTESARQRSRSARHPCALDADALRAVLGEVVDGLLASGASAGELTLCLPQQGGAPLPSMVALAERKAEGGVELGRETRAKGGSRRLETGATTEVGESISFADWRVATLSFEAADAMDFLTGARLPVGERLVSAPSLRYWTRLAELVMELLAGQRFVPAVHHVGDDPGGDGDRGYWRPVVDDPGTSSRLQCLIASMPPVCLAAWGAEESEAASDLVENFLLTCVDTQVRRCLEGDELAHAILDTDESSYSPQMRWLRSLVSREADIGGNPEERQIIRQAIGEWLARLDEAPGQRSTRTCLRLDPPVESDASLPDEESRPVWTLRLQSRSVRAPTKIMDASQLVGEKLREGPRLFPRPFDRALEELRADVVRAARHFPPLAQCTGSAEPVSCRLTHSEAYSFLRDAAPILEAEGFEIIAPSFWRSQRRRLRLWLNLRPREGVTESRIDSPTAKVMGRPETPPALQPSSLPPLGLDSVVEYDWRVAVGDEELSLEELSALARARTPLVMLRGKWTEVQPVEVETALRFLSKDCGGAIPVAEALRRVYLADDLPTGLGVAGVRAAGWVKTLLGEIDDVYALQPLAPPPGFRGTLRPYQLRGLEWFSFLTKWRLGGCLADDMGLGKTIQLIALLLHERETASDPSGSPSPQEKTIGPTLLVVPTSLVGNWQRELERFAPSLRVMVHHGTERITGPEFAGHVGQYDVVISTYGLIYRDFPHLADVAWRRIALDEAQNIKNPAAKQARAVRALHCEHRVALTGTPVENRLSELWSILEFLNPGYLGSAGEFRRRFAVPIERYRDEDRAQRLRHLIRPFVLRRVKSDPRVQIDLPEKMEMKVFCNLTREQAALYQQIVDEMLGAIDNAGGIQRRGLILAALVKLKQICNHPAQVLGDSDELIHRSGKCDRLTEMVDEVLAEGDRALIFTQFRQMGGLLKKLLEDCFGREVLFLHGGTMRKARDAIVMRFQDRNADAPLLILSLKAGGYGLNLTAASHVFHFDRWWNPAVEDQATDRVYRIGQDQRVLVHKFMCIGTLEERIDGLLEQKRSLADRVVGAGEEWLTELSTQKLREILALSREAVSDE